MKPIVFPLEAQMQGPAVANLQASLALLGLEIDDEEKTAQRYGASTQQAVSHFQRDRHMTETGEVDEATANVLNNILAERGVLDDDPDGDPVEPPPVPAYSVIGRVLHADGPPVAHAKVQAFHKNLRSQIPLGGDNAEGIYTDAKGFYRIGYDRPPGVNQIDLVVQVTFIVFEPEQEVRQVTSPLVCDARRLQMLDVIVGGETYRGFSEFERLNSAVQPHLDDALLVALNAEDIEFLACKTAQDGLLIAYLVAANRYKERTGVAAAAFYGFFRRGLPISLPALLSQQTRVQCDALQAAVTANIVPVALEPMIDDVLRQLKQAAVNLALEAPEGQEQTSLSGLLATTGLSAAEQNTLLTRYALHEGTIAEFWTALKEDPSYGPAKTENLQYTLQLGTLTGGYVPLVAELQAMRVNGDISAVQDLVGLPAQDWLALVEETGTPPNTPGETPGEQARNYVTTLQQTLQRAFPTQAIVEGVRRTQPESDLITFFDNNPDFAFTSHIDRYLQDRADTAFAGVADVDVPGVTQQLKGMQRLYRLTPDIGRFKAITALSAAGLNSAQNIVLMGKEPFTKSLGPILGGASLAESIFNKADQTAALALTIFSQYSTSLHRLTPAVIGTTPTAEVSTPTWQTLFGPLSFCACEHCRSVYSPAAYLVDLLQFLKQQWATNPDGTVRDDKTALDVLFETRPDIGCIELSCDNTNTVMPYIDLVNEILESAVARQPLEAQQTMWTAEELRANAEYTNDLAYRRVALEVYPRLLPFNLWLWEARTYLGHLGVSLAELMDILQRRGLADLNQPDLEQAIAFERLGLAPQAAGIVMGVVSPPYQLRDYWGWPSPRAGWPEALADLPTFLRQAEISYAALLELLAARFINPAGNISIDFTTLCNIEGATILNLAEPELDRIQRFLRLQTALGWTTLELDQAITAMQAADLTAEFLMQMSQIRQLNEQLTTPIIEMLSWWAPISTAVSGPDSAEVSFYESLFLNKAVLSPVDEAFQLKADRSDLENAGTAPIGEHTAAILAALTLTEADFLLVLEYEGLSEADGLTLDRLSKLFRNISFARALGLSVKDFLSVRTLTGGDPFADPQATVDFATHAEIIGESDFSVAELDYLLRHVYEETSAIAPLESSITLVLDGISAALQAIAAENVFAPDPTGSFTANRLALLLAAEDVQTAMLLLAGDSLLSDIDQELFIEEQFAAFLDVTDAKTQLVGSTALETPEERYAYVLDPLLLYLRQTLSTQQVVQTLAGDLALDTAIAEALLTQYVLTPGNPAQQAIDTFLAITPDTEYSDEVLNTYRLLHKIALVLTKFGTTADELIWLFDYGPRLGWLDLTRLPLTAISDAAALAQPFQGWERLVAIYQLRDAYPAGDATIFHVLELAHTTATRQALLEELSAVTGWNFDDLVFLTGADGFDLAYPLHYGDERYLVRLDAAVALLKRLGLAAATVAGWRIAEDLGDMRAIARDIKSTVKAKYTNEAWLPIAEPLKNTLREQQRSALVAHLIAADAEIEDSSGLYKRYLIDVDMNACMGTSRIKQAISSVQLFIQRCLMNLEPYAEILEAAAEQWQWMKNYRVWEANRKVFLYPENWILPELRDDKSPFFKELENELLQNEITETTAENALIGYLGKLDEVANLDVRALYHQKEDGVLPIDILHVVARTQATPYVYYYRQFVDGAYWTAWERVSADIQGDHLLAVVWNRRLYLMWPVFTEITIETEITTETPVETEPCESLGDRVHFYFPNVAEDNGIVRGLEDTFEDNLNVPGYNFHARQDGTNDASVAFTELEQTTGPPDLDIGTFNRAIDDWLECQRTPQATVTTTEIKETDGLEIQLAWSEYKEGAWIAKKVTEETLTVLHRRKQAIFFKPVITMPSLFAPIVTPAGDELTITCYSPRPETVVTHGSFRFTGCNGRVVVTSDDEVLTLVHLFDASISLKNMQFVEDTDVDLPLILPLSTTNSVGNWTGSLDIDNLTALNKTPGQFSLAVPHQYNEYVGQDEIFYQDETHCFHVAPHALGMIETTLRDENSVQFEMASHSIPSTQARTEAGGVALRHQVSGGSRRSAQNLPGRANQVGQGSAALTANRVNPLQDVLNQSGTIDDVILQLLAKKVFDFHAFSHPHVCTFFKEINGTGVDGLLQRSVQALSAEFFVSTYDPDLAIVASYPLEDVDFANAGAYSLYNWELFFHAPLLIATRLSQNQRFEEAQRWFHYIFNPTLRADLSSVIGPERYWVFYPFYLNNPPQDLNTLLLELNAGDPALEAQVAQWRAHPFNPHLIARLRPEAYQKTVVMKYLDNLIAWGDSLFRRDTIESINEATLLYILAADLLGPRPESLPATEVEDNQTYCTLEDELDVFSNALVEIEDQVPATLTSSSSSSNVPLPTSVFYFCIPNNEQLLGYWDTVADRLFKIRNCMNIEGVVRQLALFEPPIDPALLVQAFAAGIDISSILSDLYGPPPLYRFQVMLQKTMEFCGDVRSLGAALLSSLEKQDGEALALLRASHEQQMLEAARQVREKQVEEATESLGGLQKARTIAEARRIYYEQLVSEGLSAQESSNLAHLESAQFLQSLGQGYEIAASIAFAIPDNTVGSPTATGSTFGGSNVGNVLRAYAGFYNFLASIESYQANRASIKGGYDRRIQDWAHQADVAVKDIEQIDKQIAAAQIRVAIAEQELDNHNKQIEQAQEVSDFMTNKYTNDQLYSWMVSQISSIYFQSYQLAYDLAKRAEKAYQNEQSVTTSFITFGYWDSLKKGLLSGEKLQYDIRRMEMSYLELNKREYEITKHISLAMLDPVALIALRETGMCSVSIPEALFDLDYPGHYLRRIKNVSITIPCVTGPYTGVNCTLTLLKSSIRQGNTLLNGTTYARDGDTDVRFTDSFGAIQSIVTSSGQNDAGLFETNLRDERYLPFEGAGVISEWSIELPSDFPAFDYATIADAVLHLRYTAREAGGSLKTKALAELHSAINAIAQTETGQGAARLFSLRYEFPTEWRQFLNPAETTTQNTFKLTLSKDRFPFLFQGKTIEIDDIHIYVKVNPEFADTHDETSLTWSFEAGTATPSSPVSFDTNLWNGLLHGLKAAQAWEAPTVPEEGAWTLAVMRNNTERLDPNALDDLFVVCYYAVS